MASQKKCLAVQLGGIYDAQATKRKQQGLPVRSPIPPLCTPDACLVVYDPKPAGIHTNTTNTKNLLNNIKTKTLIRFNSNTFCEEYIQVNKYF
jgi:hypothetical protein